MIRVISDSHISDKESMKEVKEILDSLSEDNVVVSCDLLNEGPIETSDGIDWEFFEQNTEILHVNKR